MDQNAWIMLLVGIAVASALFALGVVLYPNLKSEKQGCPIKVGRKMKILNGYVKGVERT